MARKVQQTLHRLEPAQAQATIDYWGAFEDIALAKTAEDEASGASLSSASTALGTFSAAGLNLFSKAQMELDNLANLYQRIDSAVPAWLCRPLSLPVSGEALKRKIGIEASQALHSLRTATEGCPYVRSIERLIGQPYVVLGNRRQARF